MDLFALSRVNGQNLMLRHIMHEDADYVHALIPPQMQVAYVKMELSPDDLPIARRLAAEKLGLPVGRKCR